MGNSQTKEARGQQDNAPSNDHGVRNDANTPGNATPRSVHRASNPKRGTRPDFSSLLGIGTSHDPDHSVLEARRENKVEREARRQERERTARLKERERSMREEHVDGGYLVTQGVYVGIEDYSKPLVRQLQIERRLAPFWRGLNDFSDSWAEHQLMAAARGMPIPPPDEVPPELEYTPVKTSPFNGNLDRSVQNLTIPIAGRAESFHSDSAKASPVNTAFPSLSSPPSAAPSSPLFRARAKTLASLGSASRNASDKDLSPRELKLPHDPFVNGQPIEVFLYKDASECPICFLYYPPYLNTTRCCEQSICSECFVQIKRPDPHPPEHNEPDPNAPPVSAEERQAQAEGLLVSEVATCPYCKQPEFGITYTPPPFRRGLTYASGAHPYQLMSARSSQTSVASGAQSPAPGRRRGTSLSATNPEVITTDKVRPDWANKLASARAHAARRSAAASALHAAAYLMNDQNQRSGAGPFARRTVLRRPTLGGTDQPSDAQLTAMSFLSERHASAPDRGENGVSILAPPRGSSSRRSRMDDLEEMMMMEAIRLSLAAEEDRRKKEEKEARKKAKKEEKEQKKAEKAARKHGQSNSLSTETSIPMQRTESNISSILTDDTSKGKGVEYRDDSPDSQPLLDGESGSFMGARISSSLPGTSQESLSTPANLAPVANAFKRSHLRQMSNASSASSSFQEPTSSTPPLNEPMFNFRSLAAMIGDGEDEKADRSQHLEDTDDLDGENGDLYHLSLSDEMNNETPSSTARSKENENTAMDELNQARVSDTHM